MKFIKIVVNKLLNMISSPQSSPIFEQHILRKSYLNFFKRRSLAASFRKSKFCVSRFSASMKIIEVCSSSAGLVAYHEWAVKLLIKIFVRLLLVRVHRAHRR